MTDELFFRNLDYFDSLNVPYCILNNTLLSVYRDKKVFPAEARQTVFLVPADKWSFIHGQGKTYFTNTSTSGYGAIDMNEKICVNFYTEVGDKIVINPAENKYFVYDREAILPFRLHNYKDRDIYIPNKPEEYLRLYYGKDWDHPIPDNQWNWIWSPHLVYAVSPEQAAESQKEREK